MTGRTFVFRGAVRQSNGSIARFVSTAPHAIRKHAALPADHAAVAEGRTLFPSTVVSATEAPRLLVSGRNSAKLGDRVRKGPWKGMPIYQLTLEERATCPRSCHLWRECFGNAMPMARRHRADVDLMPTLARELDNMMRRMHPGGILVRLHVLGDFYSTAYAAFWRAWLLYWDRLHVFGYTHHPPRSPIGRIVADTNTRAGGRCAIRFSVRPNTAVAPMQVTTIWRKTESPHVPEGFVCPASLHHAVPRTCATCGACWHPALAEKRIVFIGHGMARGRKGERRKPDNDVARRIEAAGGSLRVAAALGVGLQAVERYRFQGRIPAGGKRGWGEKIEATLDRLAAEQEPLL